MGSTGYGRFGDYKHSIDSRGDKSDGMSGILSDVCPTELVMLSLEDVCQFEYYAKHNTVPAENDIVFVPEEIRNGRIVVSHSLEKKTIGSVPSEYNKYINCFSEYTYEGVVVSSGLFPIPHVVVSLKRK